MTDPVQDAEYVSIYVKDTMFNLYKTLEHKLCEYENVKIHFKGLKTIPDSKISQ